MTAQREDKIYWNCNNYVLQGYDWDKDLHSTLFSPHDYGLTISKNLPTDCYRGFACNYRVDNKKLYLSEFEFYSDGLECPTINNVVPELIRGDNLVIYTDVDIPLKFTGRMCLADGFISSRYRHMGFQESTSYETIFELNFRDGVLISFEDQSSRIDDMRNVQKIVDDYLTKHYVPPRESRRLHETFAFGQTDILHQFSDAVDGFDPDKALRILDEIEESRKDIRWFIRCHLAYYNEMHRYSHTFKQLEYIGVPAQLLSALQEIKGDTYQEESVVLALLQVLLEGEADGKWGNVLPTVFERQINKANLPQDLVDSVRRVITALYR